MIEWVRDDGNVWHIIAEWTTADDRVITYCGTTFFGNGHEFEVGPSEAGKRECWICSQAIPPRSTSPVEDGQD